MSLKKINPDNYLITWDWKESLNCEEINNVMKENMGRMPKFFNVESGSDDYNIIVSFSLFMTQKLAQTLFNNQS